VIDDKRKEPAFPFCPWLDALIDAGIEEDVAAGDVTTELAIDPRRRAVALVVARSRGVVAGLPLLEPIFSRLSTGIAVAVLSPDGTVVSPGEAVAELRGPVAPILTGERLALNFLQQLSGIATLTAEYVREVAGTSCVVLDTRKTVPGYRDLAKYAVRCGGGVNHRQGLYDRYLLKDNHWAARAAGLDELVARARADRPDLLIEVEVDTIAQLRTVLPLRVDWIMLDNFDPDLAAEAVAERDREEGRKGWRTRLEASGNIDLATAGSFARAGVDAVSVGRLTHSAPALDLGLDISPGDEDQE